MWVDCRTAFPQKLRRVVNREPKVNGGRKQKRTGKNEGIPRHNCLETMTVVNPRWQKLIVIDGPTLVPYMLIDVMHLKECSTKETAPLLSFGTCPYTNGDKNQKIGNQNAPIQCV